MRALCLQMGGTPNAVCIVLQTCVREWHTINGSSFMKPFYGHCPLPMGEVGPYIWNLLISS